MIVVDRVYRRYGQIHAIDGATLHVAAGEITGLVGQNGAGKSTLVDVISGLLRADSGSVRVGGLDVRTSPRAIRSQIGLAPQELGLYRRATVRQNLHLFAEMKSLSRSACRVAIETVAKELQLDDVLDRPVVDISGGQQRRTQTATAMLTEVPVLILDEPTVGADPETRSAILQAVKRRSERGAAVIYTTHYLPELVELEATLAVMKSGRVISRGSQSELLAHLPHRLVVRFTGALPSEIERVAEIRGDTAMFATMDPSGLLARIMSLRVVVTNVDIQRPSLDDMYAVLARDDSYAH
jgi:ABC-2 type transport system ATP-binding protein